MVITGHSASLALLLSLAFGVAHTIRSLKDGPMIDAEGRQYKSAVLTTGENSGSDSSDETAVHVRCTETSMIITVKADLFKYGRLVSAGELFLGGEGEHVESSQCQAVAVTDTELVIEAGLQDCGSKLTMSEDFVTYSNQLMFSPATSHHGVTRMIRAVVPVNCHYKRTHFVSSYPQQPLVLSASAKYSAFSLKLMTGDWRSEMSSNVFYLGDLLHLEASYTGPDAEQRLLFIDSCVATLTPDATSVPRYYFVENHGCVTDAKEEGSNALIHPRTRADLLQLQLDAILFHHDPRNSIFITCQLKATSETWESSSVNKACNYVYSSWKNVDGNDGVCRCCENICHHRSLKGENICHHRRSLKDLTVCGTVTLGPFTIFPS